MTTRRTLLRAAAWSAPAVTLVAAAPAQAASTGVEAFALSVTRPSDGRNGYAYVSAANLSARTTITVSVHLPFETATARYGGWFRPAPWVPGGATDSAYVLAVTLAPLASTPRPFGFGWTLVSGDGAYDLVATSAGLPSQAVSLPWLATPPA